MSLPRVSAAAVAAAEALDRADTHDELESIWNDKRCDTIRGASGIWLRKRYREISAKIAGTAAALKLARAI